MAAGLFRRLPKKPTRTALSRLRPRRERPYRACARAASGHAAAAPPRSVMNSRRRMCPSRPILIASPSLQDAAGYAFSANPPYSAAPHAYYFT